MRVGVLGIGKTPHKIQHGKSLRDLVVESGRGALADAGVEPADIQALYVGNVGSVGFNYENSTGLMSAHHLGVVPAGAVRVEAACGTGAWALHLGCVAILSGLYDTVMVLGAEKMNDLATVEGTSIIAQAADSKEEYFSGLTFPSGVALTARKYMQTYDLTEEDLAHTSVKNHHYGARNPYAHLRFECTVEEVMRSAKVADPLKLYEVCPMTDASSALVLCREEILRDQPDKPQVYVTATQMATGTWYAATDTLADAHALLAAPAQRAYEMAGVSADDVDVAEIYNSFAIQEPLGVEALGFAEQGEGWRGAADGSTWIDGAVAVNLSGGLLCKGHPLGATGSTQAVDIVEQLRGTAPADMQRPDAEVGISACRGGPGAVGAIHLYQRLEGEVTVSAIEFSRLGPPKLRLYAMRCDACGVLQPWWEHHHCYACGGADLSEEELAGGGVLSNYTVVYYPPRDFLGQEPYVVGHITMDEGVLMPAPVVGVAPDDVQVGTRVRSTLRRMKLGHEGDIYYSQKFVVDEEAAAPEGAAA